MYDSPQEGKKNNNHGWCDGPPPINVADVNTALLDICRELENRAAHQHVHMLADDIAAIQGQLPAVGRWIWRNGAVKSQSGLVPWNVQLQNSAPQCFLWEVDASEIVASVCERPPPPEVEGLTPPPCWTPCC